jgi:hypothetical protein
MLKLAVAALVLLAGATAAAAELYGPAELATAARMQPRIAAMLTEDIPAALPRAQRPAAAAVRIAFPERLGPHPMGFYAEPAARTVHVPLETVRFLDDFALLLAWDNAHGCEDAYIDAYLYALLRAGQRLPPPLTAFRLDRDAAIADAMVDGLAQKILKSQVYFLLAHELGHILLGHDPRATAAASRRQEMEADAFALDRFAAIGTAPLGMVAFFYAARYLDPTGQAADLGTHPVFSARLTAIADRLAADPRAFSFSEDNSERGALLVGEVAAEIARMAELGSDEDLLDVLPDALLRDYPLSRLHTACNR